ncbi:ABC transporter permease subunit [Pseudooceanicola sp. CBS1P-1]|uniref:ABC transporter permease subunit n=2 Tax=Paracoccaceae TaxID=31989 RepID=A0A6L7G7W8_9RHOB|nr:ABC transporter permease subunit [Pseudooceanicola endophyticus]MXN18783.1 ABC transporter permease subunit [Pseudooceanicola albus]
MLIVISALVFFAVDMLPGDVARAILGSNASTEALEALRLKLGLDQPAVLRYFEWARGVLHGDFGVSLGSGEPVAQAISFRLYNTLFLAGLGAVISVPLALALGIGSALWRGSLFDRAASILTLGAISMPEFFVAYTLVAWFALHFQIFPPIATLPPDPSFGDRIEVLILPAITLAFSVVAHMMRMIRAALIDVLDSPYMAMAEMKGVPMRRRVLRHALPNAMAPIINVIVLNLAYLIVGVVVVEVIFVYPGLGQLLIDSVSQRDLPLVQASCLIFAGLYLLLNTVADVLAIAFNPRLRFPR